MKEIYQTFTRYFILSLAVCLTTLTAIAQSGTISGKITDASKAGIPSATVSVKGTKTAVAAGNDGSYRIVAKSGDVLVFSITGFTSKEVTVGISTTINVSLVEDDKDLDEVMVVGYSTIKKSKLTGSVSKLDSKVLETGVRSNPAQALAGTIPGLRVSTATG